MRPALFIAGQDLRHMLRGRETLLWTFVMPIVFFYFIGTVTRGFGGGGTPRETVAVRVGADAGFLADTLISRLEGQGFVIARPDTAPPAPGQARTRPFEAYARRLEIPARFTAAALAGERPQVAFVRTTEGMTATYTDFRVQRAVYTLLADVLAARAERGSGDLTAADIERVFGAPRTMTIESRTAGRRQRVPTGFEQAVPGTMVMFAMLVLLTGGVVPLVIERRLGLLRRLASAPIPRRSVVTGKVVARLGLAVIQMTFALLTGRLLFGVSWGPHWPMVLVVLFFYATLLACLALLLGSLARTEAQGVALGVLASNVAGALGGCWWPIEVTPSYMQKVAMALPTGWAMDALHKLVSFEMGPASVLPHLAVFTVATFAIGALAVRVFRYN